MAYFLGGLGSATFGLLGRLLAWHLGSWREAWGSAWQGPYRETRLLGLVMGILATWLLIPAVFGDLARIHRGTALGTALEEGRGCSSESGIMVLKQKTARK